MPDIFGSTKRILCGGLCVGVGASAVACLMNIDRSNCFSTLAAHGALSYGILGFFSNAMSEETTKYDALSYYLIHAFGLCVSYDMHLACQVPDFVMASIPMVAVIMEDIDEKVDGENGYFSAATMAVSTCCFAYAAYNCEELWWPILLGLTCICLRTGTSTIAEQLECNEEYIILANISINNLLLLNAINCSTCS